MKLRLICLAVWFVPAAASAIGQQCPLNNEKGADSPSASRTLEGKLVFHNDLRGWFELKLDTPVCGWKSVQLLPSDGAYKPLEIRRGCRVRAEGSLDFSETGYYSLDGYQSVVRLTELTPCHENPPLPHISAGKPDAAIKSYRVDMLLNTRPGDHPLGFRVTSNGKELRPWQSYASYYLTGGFVLYGMCGEGFAVDKVYGPRKISLGHMAEAGDADDRAAFDEDAATQFRNTTVRMSYTCVRLP